MQNQYKRLQRQETRFPVASLFLLCRTCILSLLQAAISRSVTTSRTSTVATTTRIRYALESHTLIGNSGGGGSQRCLCRESDRGLIFHDGRIWDWLEVRPTTRESHVPKPRCDHERPFQVSGDCIL